MRGGTLLDRLAQDAGPANPVALRERLRRDLEALLNSRRRMISWPPELEELERSLVNYGLDDLTNETLASADFRERFVEVVERLVRRLEPRLGRFEVTVLPSRDELDRVLRFRIAGSVTLGGEAQDLSFDSHVDPVRSYLVMRG